MRGRAGNKIAPVERAQFSELLAARLLLLAHEVYGLGHVRRCALTGSGIGMSGVKCLTRDA